MNPAVTAISWVDIVLAVGLLAAISWIGARATKTSAPSEEEYLIGGRDIHWFPLACTIAAGVIGGGVLLLVPEYVFKYGLSALMVVLGIVVGTLWMGWIAIPLKVEADNEKFYTLPDLFLFEWGRKPELFASLTVGLWSVGFIVMQLISAGAIFHLMTGWSPLTGSILSAVFVLSYLLLAGFRAVVVTDIVQYWALLLLLVLILPTSIAKIDLWVVLSNSLSTHMPVGDAVGFFILGAVNMVVSADLWQRVYAARSVEHARKGIRFSAALIAVVGVLLAVPALYANFQMKNLVASNYVLVESLLHILPRSVLAFTFVCVTATVIATLDTMVFILGISVAHDLQFRILSHSSARRTTSVRVTTVVALALGVLLSHLFPQLEKVGLALSTVGLTLAPAILLRKTKLRPTNESVEWGLGLGLITTIFLLISNKLTPESSLWALGMTIGGMVVGGLYSWALRR